MVQESNNSGLLKSGFNLKNASSSISYMWPLSPFCYLWLARAKLSVTGLRKEGIWKNKRKERRLLRCFQ
jgi:hypothetical protein